MITEQEDPEHSARMIHKSLGGTTPFFRGYTISELMLFLGVAFLSFVGAGLFASLTIPFLGLGVMLTIVLLLLHQVKPDYLWLTEWLSARIGWAIKDKENTHAGEDNSKVRYLTRLSRIYPHAIERTDGALVGAMQVEPANMALEDEEAWTRATRSLAEFANATLDFETEIYITSREVDQDDVVRAHQQRLGDPDVRSRPILKQLLSIFVERNLDENGDIDPESATVREYYLISAVRDDDVGQFDETGDSVLAHLAEKPVVGRLFGRFQSDGISDEQREQLKEDKLESRLAEIRRGASSLYRCSVSPVDSHDLARLTKEYWSGRTAEYDDLANAMGSFPVVSGEANREADEGGLPDLTIDEDEEIDVSHEDKLDDPSKRQQSIVAPSSVDWETTYAVLNDETYVRTFWIEQFPEEPANGMLEKLLLETDLRTDIAIHIDPEDNQSAVDIATDWISDLKVQQHDANSIKSEDLQDDISRAKYMRRLLKANKASFFRTGVYIRLCADSKQELDNHTKRLRSIIKDAPANSTLKVASRWQEKGLVTVSPMARNELGTDRMSMMTDHAIGAMFPFSSNYQMMAGGIEYGYHGHNGTPIRINPWDLETGHSELVVGMPGAGKTFGATDRLLRMMKRHQDTMLVLVDPVGGFQGIADALNAKTITVGGDTRINPLEIRETPQEVLEARDSISPLSAKKDEVYAIIENFLAARDIELGSKSGVLSYAIDEAYRQAGAYEDDVTTHDPENSATMLGILDVLADISQNSDEHDIGGSPSANERAAEYADDLLIALQPFQEGGVYENLSKPSEIDILEGDNKVVYLDLGQIEGSAAGIDRQTFLMQLLLSTIYQQAKKADRNVELAIDEAHYLFENQANLDYLETAFRHQRHAGLRMLLLSQTAQEFYETEQAEKILSMCPIKVFHTLPELDDETAEKIGLTREQRDFVRNATAGKDDLGYSEALVTVQEHGTYPLHVVADDFEKRVIDYSQEDREIIETSISSVPEELVEFQQLVEEEARQNALKNRFGLTEEKLSRLAEHDITEQDVVDAVVAETLENGSSAHARADGGESPSEDEHDQ